MRLYQRLTIFLKFKKPPYSMNSTMQDTITHNFKHFKLKLFILVFIKSPDSQGFMSSPGTAFWKIHKLQPPFSLLGLPYPYITNCMQFLGTFILVLYFQKETTMIAKEKKVKEEGYM